jgi:hypothetical protein
MTRPSNHPMSIPVAWMPMLWIIPGRECCCCVVMWCCIESDAVVLDEVADLLNLVLIVSTS